MKTYERFINYVKYDTQSRHDQEAYPSTPTQIEFAKVLKGELESLGLSPSLDNFGYLICKIPANIKENVPCVAFIAHMDTSPDASGKNVKPRIIYNYDGKDIVLSAELNIILSPEIFPSLKAHVGEDLIVTDGTTLLGADDKAGLAEIMTLAQYIKEHPEFKHGDIVIVFTPDEEVGNGTKFIDINAIGADFAYTLDGSMAGEIAYENFNAASAKITFNGKSVHPGDAKGKMLNSIMLAYEFERMLPSYLKPETTEKYEGFNHLHHIEGNVEKTVVSYIIRNHDFLLFEKQKADFLAIAQFLNRKYGENTIFMEISDSYFNMREKLDDKQEIIDIAIASIKELGITPVIEPIRGGTDGARLTYMGLACPNLGTGGYNYHGPFEYASIREMDMCVEIIKKIVGKVTQMKRCR
jgi:tripeptide aminopeptidase